jgi:hypothetical protein
VQQLYGDKKVTSSKSGRVREGSCWVPNRSNLTVTVWTQPCWGGPAAGVSLPVTEETKLKLAAIPEKDLWPMTLGTPSVVLDTSGQAWNAVTAPSMWLDFSKRGPCVTYTSIIWGGRWEEEVGWLLLGDEVWAWAKPRAWESLKMEPTSLFSLIRCFLFLFSLPHLGVFLKTG